VLKQVQALQEFKAAQAQAQAQAAPQAEGSGLHLKASHAHQARAPQKQKRGNTRNKQITKMKKSGGAFEFPSEWLRGAASSAASSAAPIVKNVAKNIAQDASTKLLEALFSRFGVNAAPQEAEAAPAPMPIRRRAAYNRRAPAPAPVARARGGSAKSAYVAKLAALGFLEPGNIKNASAATEALARKQESERVIMAPAPKPIAARLRQRKDKGGFLPLLLAPMLLNALRGSGLPEEATGAGVDCQCGGKRRRAHAKEGDKRFERAAIVKRVMQEQRLSLPEASKYVKAHGLY
jgi:hypothetical protein